MKSLLETVRVELTDATRSRRWTFATGLGLLGVAAFVGVYAALDLRAAAVAPLGAAAAVLILAHALVVTLRPRAVTTARPVLEGDTFVLRGKATALAAPRASVEAAWTEDRDLVVVLAGQRVLRVRTGHPDDAAELRALVSPRLPRAARIPLDVLQLRRGMGWLYGMASLSALVALLWALALPGGVSPALVALTPLSLAALAVVLLRRSRGDVLIAGAGEISVGGAHARVVAAKQADDEVIVCPASGGELHLDAGRPTTAEALALELAGRARAPAT
ncbi:MAG: hypothetical protein IPM79_12710 [Polyangiaceae bacterium]|jgi:hypothetical protein|nr:hypothetical protein [Polyangiaceae bacterium]MBK8938466.1 hypothetical protein [Polyangiaceae bacterium]